MLHGFESFFPRAFNSVLSRPQVRHLSISLSLFLSPSLSHTHSFSVQHFTSPQASTDRSSFVPLRHPRVLEMVLLAALVVCLTICRAAAADIKSNDTDIMIISDVDDVLRVTELWNPKRALLNTFHYPLEPVTDMPALYRDYQAVLADNIHFAYVTDAFSSLAGEGYTTGLQLQCVALSQRRIA